MKNFAKNSLVSAEDAIESIVKSSIEAFSDGFQGRHEAELENPKGTLNQKIHNIFLAELGDEMIYYSALVRSFDSSFGNMLEKMAINIAKLFFEVNREVKGELFAEQTQEIAKILESYKRRETSPNAEDVENLRKIQGKTGKVKRHDSDYYLINKNTNEHFLIELKIGGDLDNKKSRAEKEALLEQFAILSNNLNYNEKIKIFFATAYNRFGEGKEWKQERVKQFFSKDELLISREFWNFICQSENGYNIVLKSYKNNAHIIRDSLEKIKNLYLKN